MELFIDFFLKLEKTFFIDFINSYVLEEDNMQMNKRKRARSQSLEQYLDKYFP